MMKIRFKGIFKFLLFFAIGVVIFWLLYKDQDIEMIKSVLKNDVTYFWIGVALFLGLLSHISRTIRWIYLIEPMGTKPGMVNTFLAVMVGYVMNMVFPRMGEISRCGVLAKYEKISFARLFGTVVTERIMDVMMLLLFTIVAVVSQFGQVVRFLQQNPEVKAKAISLITSPLLIITILTGLVLIIVFRKKIRHSGIFKRLENTLMHLKEGLISFRYVKKKGALLFHSFFIWLMYYMMLYVDFFAFSFTSDLSPLAALTTFIMGSFGMVAPVQGGLGTWHFMTREGLALYGVSHENGVIFAFVAHTANTLLIILVGLLSMLALPLVNRKK
jgi:glycosyltransferase 2 family protein